MMAPMHPVPFGPINHFVQPPMQGGQPPRPFPGTCYVCQQSGHMAKNCPFSNAPPRGNNFKRGGPKKHGKRRKFIIYQY